MNNVGSFLDNLTKYGERVVEEDGEERAAYMLYTVIEATSANAILSEHQEQVRSYRNEVAETYRWLELALENTGAETGDGSIGYEDVMGSYHETGFPGEIDKELENMVSVPDDMEASPADKKLDETLQKIQDRSLSTITYRQDIDPVVSRVLAYHTDGALAKRYAGQYLPPERREREYEFDPDLEGSSFLPIDVYGTPGFIDAAAGRVSSLIEQYGMETVVRERKPQEVLKYRLGDRSSFFKSIEKRFSWKERKEEIASTIAKALEGEKADIAIEGWKEVLDTLFQSEQRLMRSVHEERAETMDW